MSVQKMLATDSLHRDARVCLEIERNERQDFFRQTIVESTKKFYPELYLACDSVQVKIRLLVTTINVSYGETFRETLFGSRKTERQTFCELSGSCTDRKSGKVIWALSVPAERRDTIDVEDIESVQRSSTHIAHGAEPDTSFFDKILEPAIITIASGIAVYLFFSVRSS